MSELPVAREQLLSEIQSLRQQLEAAQFGVTLQSLEDRLKDSAPVPQGAQLVEAWRVGNNVYVLDVPPDDDTHDCDAMGCGTLFHVVAVAKIGETNQVV